MLDEVKLIQVVQTLTEVSISAKAFRLIKLKYLLKRVGGKTILNADQALSAIGSIRTGGRYNIRNKFEALYLADNPDNALLEVEMMRQTNSGLQGIGGAPRVLLTVDYHLHHVLDLVDVKTHMVLGTTLEELKASWRDLNAEGIIAPTQLLGETVHNLGNIEALKVPSSKKDGAYNLVIFPDRLSTSSFVRVYDDDGFINATLP